jgi:anthranilate phosphoribosyltransferase
MTAFGAVPPNESAGESFAGVDVPLKRFGFPVGLGVTLDDLGGWPGILGLLATGTDLEEAQAAAALADVLEGNATPAQIAAFIFGLRCKGETVEEMTGLVAAMLAASERVVVPEDTADRLLDTCGTGGDRSGTINVSTIAALVVAGAGVPVCKHGGRAASSQAGSADVLEALGVVIDLGPGGVARCIEKAGIGFCFAPRYHPAMRYAVPVRRELAVPTAFNFLGPLANPARVRRQVLGVGDPAMAPKMARVLVSGGATRSLVVHGADGLDELSTTGPSTMYDWCAASASGGDLIPVTVDPASLGLAPARVVDLLGGDAAANATFARRVLAGEPGPHRDIVLLNAAAGLVAAGVSDDLETGLVRAAAAVDDGLADAALQRLIAVSRDEAAQSACN